MDHSIIHCLRNDCGCQGQGVPQRATKKEELKLKRLLKLSKKVKYYPKCEGCLSITINELNL